MRAAPALHCIALLLLAAAGGCSFSPRSSQLPPGGTRVPLTLDDHQPAVEVMLNGRGPYRVLVDTGASPALAVTPQLAKELGLGRQLGHVRLHAANGKWVRAPRTALRTVRLGDAVFHDVPAVILDVGEDNFAGVIGMGLFNRCVVTFDFPARQLSLRPGGLDPGQPDTFSTPFVYGIPLVPVSMPLRDGDGRRTLHVLLDTGSNGGVVLPSTLRDELPTIPGVGGHAIADTLGGERRIDLVKIRGTVMLGRYGTVDPVIGLAPGRGAIGTPSLRDFRVSIDQRSKRVRLELARRARGAPPATRERRPEARRRRALTRGAASAYSFPPPTRRAG